MRNQKLLDRVVSQNESDISLMQSEIKKAQKEIKSAKEDIEKIKKEINELISFIKDRSAKPPTSAKPKTKNG